MRTISFLCLTTLTVVSTSLVWIGANAGGGLSPFEKFANKIGSEKILIRELNDTSYNEARLSGSMPYLYVDRFPSIIVLCESANDVKTTVEYALDTDQPFVIRSGGHSNAGYSSCTDCILIDLAGVNQLKLRREKCAPAHARKSGGARARAVEVTAGVGNKMNDLAAFLELDASKCGKKYWVPGAYNNIGLGGLIHGGGWGFGNRKYGLTLDSVTSARVLVITEKRNKKFKVSIKKASKNKNKSLFNCIRGTVGPSCGLVLEWTLRVYEQQPVYTYSRVVSTSFLTNPSIAFGEFQKQLDNVGILNTSVSDQRAREMISTHVSGFPPVSITDVSIYDSEFQPELTGDALAEAILSETSDYLDFYSAEIASLGGLVLSTTTFNGTYLQIRCALESLVSNFPTSSCNDEAVLRSFTTFQSNLDQRGWLFDSVEEYDTFLEDYGDFWFNQVFFNCPNQNIRCLIYTGSWGGAIGDFDDDSSGFGHRDTQFDTYVLARWSTEDTEATLNWMNNIFLTIYDDNGGTNRGYCNFLIEVLDDPEEYLPFYYGDDDNIDALLSAKCEWDPTAFFDNPQGLPVDTC